MKKYYLIGFLIITLFLCHPIQIIAEEILPPIEDPIIDPVEEPIVDPIVDSVDEPIDEPVEEPVVDPVEDPVEGPIEDPIEGPIEEPIEEPVEEPIVDPIEDPIEDTIVDPIEDPVVDPVEDPIDEPIEDPIKDPVEILTYQLIINEVMIGSEVNPEKDNWIELYNPTDTEIILDGWQIRGVTKGGRWIDVVNDPALSIQPDDYFLLSYYTNSSYSALDVKPQMTKSSIAFPDNLIEIELKDPNGELSDKVLIEHIPSDQFQSYGRNQPIADGQVVDSWSQATLQINLKEDLLNTFATPNSPNSLWPIEEPVDDPIVDPVEDPVEDPIEPQPTPPARTDVSPGGQSDLISYPTYQLINEFMVNPAGDDTQGEWIELFNNTSNAIDISGWYLDDAEGNSSPYRLKENTILTPGSCLVISAPELKLSLKNSSDQVRLLDPNKEAKEIISYFEAKEDWTYAKKPNGDFDWTPLITPNAPNQFPAPPKSYHPDDVVFKSVLPNPEGQDAGNEIITLKNNLNELVELDQWKLINQKGKEFYLGGIELSPYQKLHLNPAYLNLTLVNKADQLSLIDPAGNLIDRINWLEASSDQIIFKPDYFQDGLRAKVINVIDGDTFSVLIDDEPFTVRLIGVDAPETVHPFKPVEEFGKQASDYLSNLLTSQAITLIFDETKMDTYNRLLAYVYLGNQFINADLIKNGYAYAYTRYPFKYLGDFIKYEQEAKENGLGLWQNEDMHRLAEGQDDYSDPLNDVENIEELVINENIENNEKNADEPLNINIECPTKGLKIDSILPNSEKGVSVEYIKLINVSGNTVCLNGWGLDDNLVKGSKPFQIKGGAMAPGAKRTFRKTETNISLNNSNDCASLINPLDEVVDQICYTKTHKNEIFTHEGGNWQPKRKTSSKKSPPQVRGPTRETTDYQWELKNETLNGKISFIYDEGEILYLELDNHKTVPVSYAGSKVDIKMSKQLLNFNYPVTLHVRSSGESRELIGIEQEKIPIPADQKRKLPIELKYILALLVMIAGFYGFKKGLLDKSFKKCKINP